MTRKRITQNIRGMTLVTLGSETGRLTMRPLRATTASAQPGLTAPPTPERQTMNYHPDFQERVAAWMDVCFGQEIARDPDERTHRFLEESLELAQAMNCTEEEALQLVRYVFSRPKGAVDQEVGGVMLTLAGLCTASTVEMQPAGERELSRVWDKIDKIRAKRSRRNPDSPLP